MTWHLQGRVRGISWFQKLKPEQQKMLCLKTGEAVFQERGWITESIPAEGNVRRGQGMEHWTRWAMIWWFTDAVNKSYFREESGAKVWLEWLQKWRLLEIQSVEQVSIFLPMEILLELAVRLMKWYKFTRWKTKGSKIRADQILQHFGNWKAV